MVEYLIFVYSTGTETSPQRSNFSSLVMNRIENATICIVAQLC